MTTPGLTTTPAEFEDASLRRLTRESLAGIITALALIPEVISFSVVSGVDPKVSLVASVVLGLTMSVLGGRPAMVTAAAGSVALVIGPTVRAHGVQYVLPIMLLAGLIQVAFGAAGLASAVRYIPRSVMTGFVNALGILIFCAQVPHVIEQSGAVYLLFGLTLVIVHYLPRFTQAVPSPLVAIVLVTALAVYAGLDVPHVGGEGSMAPGLPGLTPLLVPLNAGTLVIIAPAALSVAFVGILESLLTAKLVDEITDTGSDKTRETWALGIANILAGCYGGIGGCAMIGQTIVNVQLGRARTRLSTIMAALVLLVLVTVLSTLMAKIPMVALAAIMMVVSLKTIQWSSVRRSTLQRMPLPETCVMAITVAITVWTGNLAIGVAVGVLLAMVLFARRVALGIRADRTMRAGGGEVHYDVHGPVFFGSSHDLVACFSYANDPVRVSVDFTHAQIWDASSVAALDSIEAKYRQQGAVVRFTGLDARSREFYVRLTGHFR